MSGMSFGFQSGNRTGGPMRGASPGYTKPMTQRQPFKPKGVKVSDMLQHKGFPGRSNIKDPETGQFYTEEEAYNLMPQGGFPINIQGSLGGDRGRGRIGSAAGAVGSSGRPTSQRGMEERAYRGDSYGPRTGPISPDYGQYFGGLNEFSQNQQGLNQWDQLQGRKSMDEADAVASRMAQQQRAALVSGDFASARQFADALAARMGDSMNAAQPPSVPQTGNQWVDEFSTRSNPDGSTSAVPSLGGAAQIGGASQPAPLPGIMGTEQASLADYQSPTGSSRGWEGDKRATYGPYGKGSATYGTDEETTFTNGQGSALGGNQFTGQLGLQSAGDFFQGSADRTGQGNRFAKPGMGYPGGAKDGSSSLADYAQRLMKARERLKG